MRTTRWPISSTYGLFTHSGGHYPGGWGFLIFLGGIGLIGWGIYRNVQTRKEEEQAAAYAHYLEQEDQRRAEAERKRAQRRAEQERLEAQRQAVAAQEGARRQAANLAASHAIPPNEPIVALAVDESEQARFWTKQGDKCLLTNHRLVIDHANGSVSVFKIADITSISATSADEFDGSIAIPTTANPQNKIDFSSASEMQRVYGLLRSGMFGTLGSAGTAQSFTVGEERGN